MIDYIPQMFVNEMLWILNKESTFSKENGGKQD